MTLNFCVFDTFSVFMRWMNIECMIKLNYLDERDINYEKDKNKSTKRQSTQVKPILKFASRLSKRF